MVVEVDAILRLEEHQVGHDVENGLVPFLRFAAQRTLEQQRGDERGLYGAECQRGDHVAPVALPESRLVKEHDAAGWQPAATDPPAVQLPRVKCRHGVRLLRRHVRDSGPEGHANGSLRSLTPDRNSIGDDAADRADADGHGGHNVQRHRRRFREGSKRFARQPVAAEPELVRP